MGYVIMYVNGLGSVISHQLNQSISQSARNSQLAIENENGMPGGDFYLNLILIIA